MRGVSWLWFAWVLLAGCLSRLDAAPRLEITADRHVVAAPDRAEPANHIIELAADAPDWPADPAPGGEPACDRPGDKLRADRPAGALREAFGRTGERIPRASPFASAAPIRGPPASPRV